MIDTALHFCHQHIAFDFDPSAAVAARDDILAAQRCITDLLHEADLLREYIAEQTVKCNRLLDKQGELFTQLHAERKACKRLRARIAERPDIPVDHGGTLPAEIPTLRFLQLIRLSRYLACLLASDDDQDSVLANKALEYVAGLVTAVEAVRPGIQKARAAA